MDEVDLPTNEVMHIGEGGPVGERGHDEECDDKGKFVGFQRSVGLVHVPSM